MASPVSARGRAGKSPVTQPFAKQTRKGLTGSWYALRVRRGFEQYVQDHLVRKGYDTYVPCAAKTQPPRSTSPLIPSYVFCRFSASARLDILVTPGVLFVAGSGNALSPVEGAELYALHRAIESGAELTPWSYPPDGETVSVQSGPLAGIRGTLVSDSGTDRLALSISALMFSFCVSLSGNTVKALKKGA
jgi:transcription antitermination factor NusG